MRLLKNMSTKLMQSFVLLALISQSVFAEDVEIVGSLQQVLKKSNIDSALEVKLFAPAKSEKVIQLLQVQLSAEAKAQLQSRAATASKHTQQFAPAAASMANAAVPDNVQLAMNNVPVLDQGVHGTCVTFAVTGALDAAIQKGDYISQLCHLQLGTYLEKHGYGLSGWDGAYPIDVINQIQQYGVMNKQDQVNFGCGGLTQYPTYSNPKSFIDPETYSTHSELIFGKSVNWSDVYNRRNAVNTLDSVKEALNAGDRLVFATLIPSTDLGFVGAVGKYKTWFYKDTWLLTPAVLEGLDDVDAAHEMIITGYDDNAVATDDNGKKHKGLLTLRNSWGTSVGDYGEFYMSYDYFKLLAYDVKRISPASN